MRTYKKAKSLLILAALLPMLLLGGTPAAQEGRVVVTDRAYAAAPQGATMDPALYAAVPSEMELICQKGRLSLYASLSTGEFAVQDAASGHIWFSNPPDRFEDPYTGEDRANTFSLITTHFANMDTLVDDYQTSFGECEINETIQVTGRSDGLDILFDFASAGIRIPLRITLTDKGVTASVDVSAVEETGAMKLMSFHLLPYFGAGGVGDEGYLVVPDGSGALIDFNNGKQNNLKYVESLYGFDRVLYGEQYTKVRENSPLPLFGMKNGDAGFAAIITEGDAAAGVTAGVGKQGSGYNHVNSTFTVRSYGTHVIGGFYAKEVRTFEKGAPRLSACTVDYRLLTGEAASYSGIAREYTAYLKETLGLSDKAREHTALFVEYIGAVRQDQSVLGIPTKVTRPLTTFRQAQTVTGALAARGIDRLIVDYQAWDSQGLRRKVPASPKPEGKLGGSGQYKALKSYLDGLGVPLVSNVNLTSFQQGGGGVSESRDVAKLFVGIPGVQYAFKLNTDTTDKKAPLTFYLAPREFDRVTDRYLKKYDARATGAIGLDNLATDLYSDFAKDGTGRQQTRDIFAAGAARAAEKGDVYVRSGAAYLLGSTDYIFDMSDDCSHSDIVDRSIPLFQLAVAGLVPYSLTPINTHPDPDKQLLKCVEYGADLSFTFTYENPGVISDPYTDYLSGAWYEPWTAYAEQAYKRAAALDGVGSLTGHEEAAAGVYVSTFSSGARVAVNYTGETVTVEGTAVKSLDFARLN